MMWTASNLKVELQIYPPLQHLVVVFFSIIQALVWLTVVVKTLSTNKEEALNSVDFMHDEKWTESVKLTSGHFI